MSAGVTTALCFLCAMSASAGDVHRVGAGPPAGTPEAQQTPIKGQDPETAMRGQGPTGWVQAPEPRGLNVPASAAQGARGAGTDQLSPGQNPGTPIEQSLPSASGTPRN